MNEDVSQRTRMQSTNREAVPDARKTVFGPFGGKFKDILGLLWWNLFAHDLSRGDHAQLKWDQGTGANLIEPR
jgi:hypothetical protein